MVSSSELLQWEFDSHSPPVRLIWWWFFASKPRDFDDFINCTFAQFFGEGVKDYWCGKAAFWPLFFNPSGIWSWRKPAFRFAHCPKKIPSSPILCDWVSKPKFRTWRKVLKEEKWGIWSQMAKLLLLVPKVVVRVPSWEKSSASRKNSSTFFFFSSCCVFMAKSWISALAWCWQKWLRLKWKLDSPFAKSLLTLCSAC